MIEGRASGLHFRNDPFHHPSVYGSVFRHSHPLDFAEAVTSTKQTAGARKPNDAAGRPTFATCGNDWSTFADTISERERDPTRPRARSRNDLWVTAEDHEMHLQALSDQLKCAEETALQSLQKWQEDRKRMNDDISKDRVTYIEGQRRAEVEKEELLGELNTEKEKSNAFRALLEGHSRGEAQGSLFGGGGGGEEGG